MHVFMCVCVAVLLVFICVYGCVFVCMCVCLCACVCVVHVSINVCVSMCRYVCADLCFPPHFADPLKAKVLSAVLFTKRGALAVLGTSCGLIASSIPNPQRLLPTRSRGSWWTHRGPDQGSHYGQIDKWEDRENGSEITSLLRTLFYCIYPGTGK